MKALEATHVLARIVEAKRRRLEDAKLRVPEAIVGKMASMAAPVPSFRQALEPGGRRRIIAEIKKASPSAGVLIPELDVSDLARRYRAGGASALSVVTEEDFFQGSLGWIRPAAAASELPILRKDFIFDPYQLAESRAAGASAVLLIVALLDPEELARLVETAGNLGLDALVEVHEPAELDQALAAGASLIGVNNRDLRTFEVRLETSIRLGERIPDDRIFVAESGIHGRADLERLSRAGADAFLIGERLVRAPDPAAAIEELL